MSIKFGIVSYPCNPLVLVTVNFGGIILMSVARVTMVDYISEKAADEFEEQYQILCPKMIPEADAFVLVRTGPTSGLSVAIYKNEALAEEVMPKRTEMLAQCPDSIKDMFHLEGPVTLHYVNELLKKKPQQN